jgi:hypothetical protein
MKNLKIKLTNPQADFVDLQSKCLYPLFTGGYGSGKSYTLAVSAFLDALHSPNAVIGIYEPNYSLVRDVAMAYIKQLLDSHNIKYEVNKNEFTIITKSNQIGNFKFRSMENPDTIVGYETYTAHVDEIDTLDPEKADRVWNMILGRTRQHPNGLAYGHMVRNKRKGRYEPRNKVCAYSTPEGFRFTYNTWAKNQDSEYQYIKAKTEDNPFIPESYIDNLKKKYSGPLIEAYLQGEWVNLQSSTVYYAYDMKEHNSEEKIRRGETLHVGMDFNVGDMCASVFVSRKGGEEWHQVAEVHGLLDTPDVIEYIKEKWQNKGHKVYCYPDLSGSNRSATDASKVNIQLLRQAGFVIVTGGRRKNLDVSDRVACVNNAFAKRRLFINAMECPHQVECLTQQAYTKAGTPEKGTGLDNANDALGYFVDRKLQVRAPLQLLNFSFARRT